MAKSREREAIEASQQLMISCCDASLDVWSAVVESTVWHQQSGLMTAADRIRRRRDTCGASRADRGGRWAADGPVRDWPAEVSHTGGAAETQRRTNWIGAETSQTVTARWWQIRMAECRETYSTLQMGRGIHWVWEADINKACRWMSARLPSPNPSPKLQSQELICPVDIPEGLRPLKRSCIMKTATR